jgi:hypothetical protein
VLPVAWVFPLAPLVGGVPPLGIYRYPKYPGLRDLDGVRVAKIF